MKRLLLILSLVLGLAGSLQSHAQDVDRLRQQGSEARRAGHFAEAVELLSEAAKLKPDDTDLQLELGLALVPLGRYDDAEKAFRRVLELAPDYLDARLGLARIELYRKQYDKAKSEVRAVLAKQPDNTDAKALAAQIERATRPAATSVDELTKEAKQHPDDADLQLRLGLALTREKRYDDAEKAFRRVLEISPDYLDARLGLARIALYRKNYDKALSEVRAVLAKRPDDADAKNLAQQIERATRPAPASIDDLVKQIREHPDDADLQLQLGLALTKQKRYGEAEKAFRRVLEIAPDYLDARLGLARLAYYRKQYKKALSDVRAVLAKRPGDADAKELKRLVERAMRAPPEAKPAAAAAAKPPGPTPPYWRVDLNGEWSHLTGGRPPWLEGDLHVTRVLEPGNSITAGVNVARHFDQVDAYYDGRLDRKLTDWLNGYVFGGGTPNAHFRPIYAAGGGLAATVNKQSGLISSTVLTFDARYQEYLTGPVRWAAPGIQQYVLNGTFWFTAQWINALDALDQYLPGYLVRGDVMLRDDLRLFVGYSDAPETSENITIETRSVFGGIVYDVDAFKTVRASFAYEQRPGYYDRSVFSVGTSLKF